MNTERIQKRIFTTGDAEFTRILAYWRFRNFRIVFTNGCFDVLHRGHAEYLSKAADLGEILIVGMNTDASVKRLKGEARPVNNEQNRAFLMASFGFVSAVVLFEEDTPEKLIEFVKPHFLVKGADYNEKTIVGADFVKSYGGDVVTVDLVPGLSSTDIITKSKQ